MKEKQHWENIYSTKTGQQLSWFQHYPKTSMEFVESLKLPFKANIIDIGGGDSNFVDVLLEKGYRNIWVLDISSSALERVKMRLGEKANLVHWVVTDVLEFEPPVQYDLWHDRAAFHFLTNEEAIKKYVTTEEAGVTNKGYIVLGTFSETGPEKCSGLEIKQYSKASMSDSFQTSFEKIRCIEENHITPFNTPQNFLFCSFKKQ